MNSNASPITHNVVRDLLPLYASGEASADTTAFVRAYLEAHPELAGEASAAASWAPPDIAPSLPKELNKAALTRTKRLLFARSILFGLAIFVTAIPFSFGDTGTGLRWLYWADQKPLAMGLLGLAALLWLAYLSIQRRLQPRGF